MFPLNNLFGREVSMLLYNCLLQNKEIMNEY
jgi:hypothetical protein